MLDLFMSEWRRFRRFTLAAMAGHTALQWAVYLNGVYVFDKQRGDQVSLALLYMAATMLFAGIQLISYRPANRWVWLMHRPHPRYAMFGGLALAGAAHIVLAIGVPLMLTAAGIDLLTAQSVDLRHYLGVVVLTQYCLMAWLVVAATLLGRTWVGACSAVLPFVLLPQAAPASTIALAALAVHGLMLLIAFENFKPDRNQPPVGWRANVLAAIPMSIVLSFVLMIFGAIAQSFASRLTNTLADQWAAPAEGSAEAISAMEPKKRMQTRLAMSGHANQAIWEKQLANARVSFVWRDYFYNPTRQQLTNDREPGPIVTADHVRWKFDHDRMLFTGIDTRTGQSRGARGLHGAGDVTPFPLVPRTNDGSPFDGIQRSGDTFLLLPRLAMQIDEGTMDYHARIALQTPEYLVGQPRHIGDRYYAFTSQRLIAFQTDAAHPNAPFNALFSVPLPHWPSRMDRIDVAPLADVTLISMATSNYDGEGPHTYQQQLLAVDQAGNASVVQQTRYEMDFGKASLNTNWVVVPAMQFLLREYGRLNEPSEWNGKRTWSRPPSKEASIALVLLLVSSVLAWVWLRGTAPRLIAGWMVACLMLGLAALATLMVLHPRRSFQSKV